MFFFLTTGKRRDPEDPSENTKNTNLGIFRDIIKDPIGAEHFNRIRTRILTLGSLSYVNTQ